MFRQFEKFDIMEIASFEDVRLLYRSEQNSIIKLVPRLTAKSCWPSILELQNVNLALRVFGASTAAGLVIQKELYLFYSSVEEHSEASFNPTDYTDLNDLSNIHLDVTTLQSLAFVAGYSVF